MRVRVGWTFRAVWTDSSTCLMSSLAKNLAWKPIFDPSGSSQ